MIRALVSLYNLKVFIIICMQFNQQIPMNIDSVTGYKIDFYTSHHQFYIYDKFSHSNTSDFWKNGAFEDRLAIETGVLGVRTESYGPIKGELFLLENENEKIDSNLYDHIVEGGFHVNSGIMQILDCPTSSVELEIKVKPGRYRVRIYSSDIANCNDDDCGDFYKIEVWPGQNLQRKVLKRYEKN
jgi:hypothetical protein